MRHYGFRDVWPVRLGAGNTRAFWGLTATLDRLHVDRQLGESLTHGPDPLHLATVFGISPGTAIRYAATARHLLETPAEHHDLHS